MALHGDRAIAAAEAVVAAAAGLMPDGVQLEVVGHGRWWTLRKIDPANPPGVLSARVDERGGRFSATGPLAPLGVGTWIPLLPRQLDAKLSAISVVELVHEVVTDARGSPWPGPEYRVRAKVSGGQVFAWFEPPARTDAATARTLKLLPLPLPLFLRQE